MIKKRLKKKKKTNKQKIKKIKMEKKNKILNMFQNQSRLTGTVLGLYRKMKNWMKMIKEEKIKKLEKKNK